MLKKNIGNPGRLLRGSIGILLLGYALWQGSWIAGFFGLFTLFEAIASWCLFYQLIGKNSCPRK
ncbi:MAG: DUF2892 domain-containing protein [Simkaniaceae bacterium]|nr:DUF2892 domain-containing protein [Simkaniaceae bacterium]